MVVVTGSILLGLGVAAAGGWIASNLLGGETKKEQTVSPVQYAPQITEPFAQYAPQISKVYQPTVSHQLDYVYAPSIQIESPEAQAAVVTTKKEATQEPSTTIIPTSTPTISSQPTQETSATQTDMGSMILILGLAAVGGYILVSMTKKKGRKK